MTLTVSQAVLLACLIDILLFPLMEYLQTNFFTNLLMGFLVGLFAAGFIAVPSSDKETK